MPQFDGYLFEDTFADEAVLGKSKYSYVEYICDDGFCFKKVSDEEIESLFNTILTDPSLELYEKMSKYGLEYPFCWGILSSYIHSEYTPKQHLLWSLKKSRDYYTYLSKDYKDRFRTTKKIMQYFGNVCIDEYGIKFLVLFRLHDQAMYLDDKYLVVYEDGVIAKTTINDIKEIKDDSVNYMVEDANHPIFRNRQGSTPYDIKISIVYDKVYNEYYLYWKYKNNEPELDTPKDMFKILYEKGIAKGPLWFAINAY
ncbi:MAG: hypothetical protein J5525_13285 [Lachnospiraceae bacterium]|nr:hypothetical protein [Lachnospiraceae bacterium]